MEFLKSGMNFALYYSMCYHRNSHKRGGAYANFWKWGTFWYFWKEM